MSDDPLRDAWLSQRARAVVPYLDGRRVDEGSWITLVNPEGCSISLPMKDWPEIERIALQLRA
jgi:hypothetical protein